MIEGKSCSIFNYPSNKPRLLNLSSRSNDMTDLKKMGMQALRMANLTSARVSLPRTGVDLTSANLTQVRISRGRTSQLHRASTWSPFFFYKHRIEIRQVVNVKSCSIVDYLSAKTKINIIGVLHQSQGKITNIVQRCNDFKSNFGWLKLELVKTI